MSGPRRYVFHGVEVAVDFDDADIRRAIDVDFSYFAASGPAGRADVTVRCRRAEPPWDDLPEARAVLVQPGCVVFEAGGVRWVDYHGRALTRWDYATESGEVWGEDADLLHEVVYLLVQSRVGELLDRRGLHRLHALGLAVGDRGVVCMMPSGGGKTSLALAALEGGWARLLSDDTPLVDRRGGLHAFPVRIGLARPPPAWIDARFVHKFVRREHGAKWLIDVAAFDGRIAARARPSALLLGERQLAGRPSITPVGRKETAAELVRSGVVGLGLPQLVEYFVRFDPADLAAKAGLVASRSAAFAALLARSRSYRFRLGRDVAENAEVLRTFLCNEKAPGAPATRGAPSFTPRPRMG